MKGASRADQLHVKNKLGMSAKVDVTFGS